MFDFLLEVSFDNNHTELKETSSMKTKYLGNINFKTISHSSDYLSFIGYKYPEEPDGFSDNGEYTVLQVGLVFPTFLAEDTYAFKQTLSHGEIIQLYTKHGCEIVRYIKGNYILVIFNKVSKVVYGFTGKSGLLKLFYHHTGNSLLLSTTIDSLAGHPGYKLSINYKAVLEALVFGYPLGNISFLEGITNLDNHSYLKYSMNQNKLDIIRYYSFNSMLTRTPKYDWTQTYQLTPNIFNRSVDLFLNNEHKINAALTSGFDSRTVLSRTIKQKQRVQYYSWGSTPKSIDVRIPQKIARKMNLQYKWITFSDEFLQNYDFYAKQLLFFSDGLGNIKRCNQMFSHEKLAKYSRLNITGYIGSELLRPNNGLDTNILPAMKDIIYKDLINKDTIVRALQGTQTLLTNTCIDSVFDDTVEHVFAELSRFMCNESAYLNLYNYTISQSLWKFFGQEFQATRIYDLTQSPYVDDDFIEFIVQTPVPGINRHAFKRNASDLRKGQLFYLPILEKNCPELLHIITSRGYTPAQLKSALYPMNILIPFTLFRIDVKYLNTTATFNARGWNQIVYASNNEILKYSSDQFHSLNLDRISHQEYSIKSWLLSYIN
jgi:hypothetical protein